MSRMSIVYFRIYGWVPGSFVGNLSVDRLFLGPGCRFNGAWRGVVRVVVVVVVVVVCVCT